MSQDGQHQMGMFRTEVRSCVFFHFARRGRDWPSEPKAKQSRANDRCDWSRLDSRSVAWLGSWFGPGRGYVVLFARGWGKIGPLAGYRIYSPLLVCPFVPLLLTPPPPPPHYTSSLFLPQNPSDPLNHLDLDELFDDLYYSGVEPVQVTSSTSPGPDSGGSEPDAKKRKSASSPSSSSAPGDAAAGSIPVAELTEEQKLERRQRNREHAKRSRLRKKFLLESLQEQIHGLEEQLDSFKNAVKKEIPEKAEEIINSICGDKKKYAALPMPSGFGPVKTLMEPDFRLMNALSGSQQNFAISDPTLPDNPIVYVSQGFLDLTGYTLDQVLGRNCRFLQGPGTDQSAVAVIRKGIEEGVDTSVCLLNYKADGTPFWNQFFVAALRDAQNNVVNYVGVQCEVSKAVVEKHMGEQQAT